MSLLSAEQPPPPRSSGIRLVIGSLLVLAALAGGGLLLLRGPDEAPPTRAAAPADAATPRPLTGTLRVTADAEGAVVLLDGRRLGLAPQTATGLSPGRHRVRIERFGREPFEEEVEVAAGEERTLHAALGLTPEARARARNAGLPALRVVSDVPGASVFLDREFVGKAPVEIAELSPGPHRLNVSAEGYEMYAEEIEGGTAPREVRVRFTVVRLEQRVEVEHKRAFGSNDGVLTADPAGLRFESENSKDSFGVPFEQLEDFAIDYMRDNLKVKLRGGRTYNFTSRSGDPDELFVFHREVEAARSRLAADASP
jgi:hypothetical protein